MRERERERVGSNCTCFDFARFLWEGRSPYSHPSPWPQARKLRLRLIRPHQPSLNRFRSRSSGSFTPRFVLSAATPCLLLRSTLVNVSSLSWISKNLEKYNLDFSKVRFLRTSVQLRLVCTRSQPLLFLIVRTGKNRTRLFEWSCFPTGPRFLGAGIAISSRR